jgi:glycosyltransferase involved in cell wall biosynthesis
MHVFVDASVCSDGALQTYATGLIERWAIEDRLTVLAHPGLASKLRSDERIAVRTIYLPDARFRRWRKRAEEITTGCAEVRPDVFLGLTPFLPGQLSVPSAVVCYDFRHRVAPREFSIGARLARLFSYGPSLRRADRVIAISERTRVEFERLYPRQAHKVAVVRLAADHVESWAAPDSSASSLAAIAMGHRVNKRPGHVIDAFAMSGLPGVLAITGLSEGQRTQLQHRAEVREIGGRVWLAPYLDDDGFRSLFSRSNLLVVASSVEGFCLPVAEAMRLGKPVACSPDGAVIEAGGGEVFAAADFSAESLALALRNADNARLRGWRPSREWLEQSTWARVAHQTREVLSGVVR